MLDDAQRRERDALRAAVFGPPSAHPATAEERARLEDLERAAAARPRAAPATAPAVAGPTSRSEMPGQERPSPSSRSRSWSWWGVHAAIGVLVAALAFVCGLSVGQLQAPSPVVASSADRDDPDAVRSFARVTAYVNWDQPSLLGVSKYGNRVTAWTGRVGDGELDCAAFDDGFEVAVQCLRTASNPLPHSFTWVKGSDPDRGEYSIRVGRNGGVDAWFVATESDPR